MRKFDNGNIRVSIFPTLVYVIECSDLVEDVKSLLTDDIEWSDSPVHGQTKDLYILKNKNPKLLKSFEDKVNEALDECNFENTFQMTTSWFTRIAPYGHIESHRHGNCVWSSVFYFEEECGALTFIKDSQSINVPQNNPDSDLAMDGDVTFPCQSGKLLLFPSHIHHKLALNNRSDIRYSMAMNYMPKGHVTMGDSSFNYG
tara:strand:- start:127 stop:729 length:603 start_codon:yes stop_codon:yes gene_type:complete